MSNYTITDYISTGNEARWDRMYIEDYPSEAAINEAISILSNEAENAPDKDTKTKLLQRRMALIQFRTNYL